MLEKRAYDLFMQNLVKGTSHLVARPWRPSPPGSARPCSPGDYTFATYRGHAHTLARGASMAADHGRAARPRRRASCAARAARCT